MILTVNTDTGIVQMEGILKADEVLDLAHELMDIAYELSGEDRTNTKFSSFFELYKKS